MIPPLDADIEPYAIRVLNAAHQSLMFSMFTVCSKVHLPQRGDGVNLDRQLINIFMIARKTYDKQPWLHDTNAFTALSIQIFFLLYCCQLWGKVIQDFYPNWLFPFVSIVFNNSPLRMCFTLIYFSLLSSDYLLMCFCYPRRVETFWT